MFLAKCETDHIPYNARPQRYLESGLDHRDIPPSSGEELGTYQKGNLGHQAPNLLQCAEISTYHVLRASIPPLSAPVAQHASRSRNGAGGGGRITQGTI